MIKENRDIGYNPIYNASIPIKEQNLRRETLSMIAILDLNYWCEDEDEKQKLKKKFSQNELKYQEELREKYSPGNLFENRNNREHEEQQTIAMVEYKKPNFIILILEKIKKLFRIKA